jgi:hypothetical protein
MPHRWVKNHADVAIANAKRSEVVTIATSLGHAQVAIVLARVAHGGLRFNTTVGPRRNCSTLTI